MSMVHKQGNVVLIGMSGAGKSTLGVLLAKALGKRFVDTDLILQAEERAVCSLDYENSVIATGGSVVYSEAAMKHLSKNGILVYLKVDYQELATRLSNITTRGIVFKGADDLRSVYEERLPLYESYAQRTVECTGRGMEESLEEILSFLTETEKATKKGC